MKENIIKRVYDEDVVEAEARKRANTTEKIVN